MENKEGERFIYRNHQIHFNCEEEANMSQTIRRRPTLDITSENLPFKKG